MQTLSDFQNATGKKDVGRYFTERGSKLQKIDSALYEYHKDNSIKNLNVLLSVYLAWLKAKVDRRQSTTLPLSRDQPRGANEPLARRRSAVAELAQAALNELAARSAGYEAGSAAHLYQRRKISWLAKAPDERSQSKGLDAGYQLERNAVVRLKKQGKNNAFTDWIVSASGLHAAQGNIVSYNALQEDIVGPSGKPLIGRQLTNIVKIAKKPIQDWTETEIEEIQRLAEKQWAGKVEYLHKKVRYDYMVNYDGSGLLRWHKTGELITTVVANGHQTAYAMDCYGNLYCRNVAGGFARDSVTFELKFFNHSSFNAGKNVICAGVLVIDNGLLIHINNMSGHYRPTKDNLIECIKVLKADSVNLKGCTATYFDPWTKTSDELTIDHP